MTRRNYFIRIFQKTFPQSPLVLEKPFPSVFFCQLQQLGLKNAIKGGSGLLPESESLVEGVMRKQPGGGTVGFEGCYTPRGEGSLKAAALQPKQGPCFCCELPAEKAGAAAAVAEQWTRLPNCRGTSVAPFPASVPCTCASINHRGLSRA